MPKVYHLNLVVETTSPGQPGRLSRFRVIVNQQGVVRIDPVAEKATATTTPAPSTPSLVEAAAAD